VVTNSGFEADFGGILGEVGGFGRFSKMEAGSRNLGNL
jgi:hypothetical protein